MINQTKSKISLLTFAAMMFAIFGFATMAQSSTSPFAQSDVDSSAQVLKGDKKVEKKCGEGKCGDDKKAEKKCGEGKCGDKKADHKCGDKKADHKCGEGKCGDKKAEKKCGEGKCGDKKAEKKCGEGKCG